MKVKQFFNVDDLNPKAMNENSIETPEVALSKCSLQKLMIPLKYPTKLIKTAERWNDSWLCLDAWATVRPTKWTWLECTIVRWPSPILSSVHGRATLCNGCAPSIAFPCAFLGSPGFIGLLFWLKFHSSSRPF